jgi:hypothetical protein
MHQEIYYIYCKRKSERQRVDHEQTAQMKLWLWRRTKCRRLRCKTRSFFGIIAVCQVHLRPESRIHYCIRKLKATGFQGTYPPMCAVVPLPGIDLSTDYSTWIGAMCLHRTCTILQATLRQFLTPESRLHRWRVLAGHLRGDSWAESVEILVFPSPTDYMLTSFGFSFII